LTGTLKIVLNIYSQHKYPFFLFASLLTLFFLASRRFQLRRLSGVERKPDERNQFGLIFPRKLAETGKNLLFFGCHSSIL
jgi:hypothetical protein